jgi:hypothetical protein
MRSVSTPIFIGAGETDDAMETKAGTKLIGSKSFSFKKSDAR